jgi:16S rRNA A1518/A1519 N6-dimethyltransferase RsmA/KsgA/DIM1 with predicted DNA glycosylase/AP lyase activity
LAADAGIAPSDLVVEFGAGTGKLTAALVDCGARVCAVEVDPRLARGLA